jgi:hypothetical protein
MALALRVSTARKVEERIESCAVETTAAPEAEQDDI